MAALRVAGGLLLFRIAYDMVLAQNRRQTQEEEVESRGREDISVFPLAIPMIAGPGALASRRARLATTCWHSRPSSR